jgi:glutathione S-transferase
LTESFAKDVNRFNKVPAIKENDLMLSESVAIFHYLGRKDIIPSRWYPKDKKALAKIDEYLQWQHTNLFNGAGMLFYMQWVIPFRTGVKPSAQEIESQMQTLTKNLDDLENIWLKKNIFLAGNEVSFADLMAASTIEQVIALKLFKLDQKRHSRVNRWMEKVRDFFGIHYQEAHSIVYSYGYKIAAKSKGSKQ